MFGPVRWWRGLWGELKSYYYTRTIVLEKSLSNAKTKFEYYQKCNCIYQLEKNSILRLSELALILIYSIHL